MGTAYKAYDTSLMKMKTRRQLKNRKNLADSSTAASKGNTESDAPSRKTVENLSTGGGTIRQVLLPRLRSGCSDSSRRETTSETAHSADATSLEGSGSGAENFKPMNARRSVKSAHVVAKINSKVKRVPTSRKKSDSSSANENFSMGTSKRDYAAFSRQSAQSTSETENSGSTHEAQKAVEVRTLGHQGGIRLRKSRSELRILESSSASDTDMRLRLKNDGQHLVGRQKQQVCTKIKRDLKTKNSLCDAPEKNTQSSAFGHLRPLVLSASKGDFLQTPSCKHTDLPIVSDENLVISSTDVSGDDGVHSRQKSDKMCSMKLITLVTDEEVESTSCSNYISESSPPNNIADKTKEFSSTRFSSFEPRPPPPGGIGNKAKSLFSGTAGHKRKPALRPSPSLNSWLRSARPSSKDVCSVAVESTELEVREKNVAGVASPSLRRSMRYANMHTPPVIQRVSKLVDSSTPCDSSCSEAKCDDDLFGFENLLEPAAKFLDDVSPIPMPKSRRKKNPTQNEEEAKPWDGLLNITNSKLSKYRTKRSKRGRRAKNNAAETNVTIDESEVELFRFSPVETDDKIGIPDEYLFDRDEQRLPKKNKPLSKPKQTLEFDVENALPWREIMEHELVIENV